MNMTHHGPSPGDSATNLSGIEAGEFDSDHVISDESPEGDWSLPVWEDSDLRESDATNRQHVSPARSPAQAQRQRLIVILLASYASAVTIALFYLLWTGVFGRSHELESLPDVRPLQDAEFQYVPPQAALPPGHQLPIGEARRFGHILVEPLRVTSGQADFVHFSGNADRQAPAGVPALKLWVRLTNLSDDQLIAPLDRTLVFRRDYREETDQLLANNFIAQRDADARDESLMYLLDHPLTSEWDLVGQPLGIRLKPGESIETYLPSETNKLGDLHGQLVWRMHIRKGYHAPTGHGVTTLVDVEFDAENIQAEAKHPPSSG